MSYQHYYCVPISEEEAIRNFKYLQYARIGDYSVEKKENAENDSRIGISTNGNKASNLFFQEARLKTKYKNNGSYEEWVQKNGIEKLQTLALTYSKRASIEECKEHDYQSVLNLRVGTINQFKPRVAACLYEQLKPTCILDFCAGWGDRCVAALAKGINYIGFDTNVTLKQSYQNMIDFYTRTLKQDNCRIPNIDMHFSPSEQADFSQLSYDMVFTSPPYYDLEKYENMPEYESFEDWCKTFLCAVVENAWKYLKQEGWMCLNLPGRQDSRKHTKYDIFAPVQEILGEPTKKIQMIIQHRQKDKNTTNFEYIYCWKKTNKKPAILPLKAMHIQEEVDDVNVNALLEENKLLREKVQALEAIVKLYMNNA
jgi:tRNA1(Val) A37 N6-methylase TrmN6